MPKKILKCRDCVYVFIIHFYEEEVKIICPYCKKQGKISEFEDTHQTEYGIGYMRTFEEFNKLLRDVSRDKIQMFFQNVVRVIAVEFKNGKYVFTEENGNEISRKKVHEFIQNDVVLQRDFYNIWMDYYR